MLLLVGEAAAGGRSRVRNDVYVDEQITVISPAASTSVELGERFEMDAGVAIDVLSGATPVLVTDVISSATRFVEQRYGTNAGVTFRPQPTWDVRAAAGASTESDHRTISPSVGASTELFHRMSKLEIGYAFLYERVGMVDDPDYGQTTLGHTLDLRWGQIIGRSSTLTFIASGQFSDCEELLGCQANPYRRVPLVLSDGNVLLTVGERHPGTRLRGAAALRLSQYLGRDTALHGGYRFYADDWSVIGHTSDVGVTKTLFGGDLRFGLEGRFTWQESASFYRDTYEVDAQMPDVPSYRSADREAARMYNVLAGARAEYQVVSLRKFSLGLNARTSRIWYRYLNYSVLDSRDAWVVGLGVSSEY